MGKYKVKKVDKSGRTSKRKKRIGRMSENKNFSGKAHVRNISMKSDQKITAAKGTRLNECKKRRNPYKIYK